MTRAVLERFDRIDVLRAIGQGVELSWIGLSTMVPGHRVLGSVANPTGLSGRASGVVGSTCGRSSRAATRSTGSRRTGGRSPSATTG